MPFQSIFVEIAIFLQISIRFLDIRTIEQRLEWHFKRFFKSDFIGFKCLRIKFDYNWNYTKHYITMFARGRKCPKIEVLVLKMVGFSIEK